MMAKRNNKAQPRFHVGPNTSLFKHGLAAVRASYKIADKYDYVPYGRPITSRQVACFFHKNRTKLQMLPDLTMGAPEPGKLQNTFAYSEYDTEVCFL